MRGKGKVEIPVYLGRGVFGGETHSTYSAEVIQRKRDALELSHTWGKREKEELYKARLQFQKKKKGSQGGKN